MFLNSIDRKILGSETENGCFWFLHLQPLALRDVGISLSRLFCIVGSPPALLNSLGEMEPSGLSNSVFICLSNEPPQVLPPVEGRTPRTQGMAPS